MRGSVASVDQMTSPPSKGLLVRKIEIIEAASRDQRLTDFDVRVALCLGAHINHASERAWPSAETVARQVGGKRRSVVRALQRLVECGYYLVAERGGGVKSTVYTLGAVPDLSSLTCDPTVTGDPRVTGGVTLESLPCDPTGTGGVTLESQEPIERTCLINLSIEPERESAPELASADDAPEDKFRAFWQQFPKTRRSNEVGTRAKYNALIKARRVTHEDLIAAVMRYGMSRDVLEGFACNPLRWLREERWKLDYQPATAARGGGSPGGASVRTTRDVAQDLINDTDHAQAVKEFIRI